MPLNNNTPIVTETQVIKIKVDSDLGTNIQSKADAMGEKGYALAATFTLDNYVVCVFQRTR